jgi:mono/diheme cytochrome c family protein
MKKTPSLTLAILIISALSSAMAADAKENWDKHCAKCHGADGKGQTTMGKKLKVKDYTIAKEQESFTDEEAIKITKEGKKEGGKTLMKGFADVLSDDEIKALVAYVRDFKK